MYKIKHQIIRSTVEISSISIVQREKREKGNTRKYTSFTPMSRLSKEKS